MTFLRMLWAIVREISDESAYQRHLRILDRRHSGEEWRRFLDQRLAQKYARPKCC